MAAEEALSRWRKLVESVARDTKRVAELELTNKKSKNAVTKQPTLSTAYLTCMMVVSARHLNGHIVKQSPEKQATSYVDYTDTRRGDSSLPRLTSSSFCISNQVVQRDSNNFPCKGE